MVGYFELILGALVVILASTFWRALVALTWRPYAITNKFRRQGVRGPPYKFWFGCLGEIGRLKKEARETEMSVGSHDFLPRVLPHYINWMSQYGKTFLYWFGPTPRLCITDPEIAKQVLSNKFGYYVKTRPGRTFVALLGRGLVLSDGSEWARHRRIISPAFTMDKLKMMTKQVAQCTQSMLDKWHHQTFESNHEHNAIEVNNQFEELTADVISHAAFGSSFSEGKQVFLAQKQLQNLILASLLYVQIPGFYYLPTKRNIQKWELDRKMKRTIAGIIQSRLNSKEDSGYGNDLLGIMLESREKHGSIGLNTNEIIDECKTFFLAGHETTSHLLSWTMFLLSTNLEWQERLREEVMNEYNSEVPDADKLSKLKLLNMVLLESLRLYCPAVLMTREAVKDMELGGLMIPKGTTVSIPIAIIHLSKEHWGEDADQFNPSRFENGVVKAAKHPNALLAFSMGPRACIGQNFAMLEAKIVVAMILRRFTFTLSPDYKHKPLDMLTLQPQNGLPIVLKPLNT